MIRRSTAIFIYLERGVQRGRFGIGHVLQIISDPPPYALLALCMVIIFYCELGFSNFV